MLKILLSKKSERFLRKLPPKHFLQIDSKLEELRKNPIPHDSILLFYRVSIGEYRIIYQFDEKALSVYVIGKRNDGEVYKTFLRQPTKQ